MNRIITITELRRPKMDGFITHEVRLPGWIRPVGTGSLEDARKVAVGYQPAPGDTVEINEVTGAAPADSKQAARAAALRL